jgi:hypothetical protein
VLVNSSAKQAARVVLSEYIHAARDWLDTLAAPDQVPSRVDRLREAMQVLVRVQAKMLAEIVVEIRSAAFAVASEQ